MPNPQKFSRRTIDFIQRIERVISLKIRTKNRELADNDVIAAKLERVAKLISQELQMLTNPQPVKQRLQVNPPPNWNNRISQEKILKAISVDIEVVHKVRDDAPRSPQKERLLYRQIEPSHIIIEKSKIRQRRQDDRRCLHEQTHTTTQVISY